MLSLSFLHIFQSIKHVKQILETFNKTAEVFIGVYIFYHILEAIIIHKNKQLLQAAHQLNDEYCFALKAHHVS